MSNCVLSAVTCHRFWIFGIAVFLSFLKRRRVAAALQSELAGAEGKNARKPDIFGHFRTIRAKTAGNQAETCRDSCRKAPRGCRQRCPVGWELFFWRSKVFPVVPPVANTFPARGAAGGEPVNSIRIYTYKSRMVASCLNAKVNA